MPKRRPEPSERELALQIPKSVEREVYARDHNRCVICHKPGLPRYRYVPKERGGIGSTARNVVTLCRYCGNAVERLHCGNAVRKRIGYYLASIYGEDFKPWELYYDKYTWKDDFKDG